MSRRSRSVVRGPRRVVAFVVLTVLFACAIAFAKGPAKKRKPVHHPPARHHPRAPAHHKDAGAAAEKDRDAGPHIAAAAVGKAKGDAGVLESKTLDGGTRVFRFGEMEIEGRLRSPQLVYFLRRVRAEFAAGDLGHRSFMGELKETRKGPAF